MRAGEALRADRRAAEEHRLQVKLVRRCSAIVSGHFKRVANLKQKKNIIVDPPNYTPEQLYAIISQRIGTPCQYCGKILTVDNFEIDHSIPIDRGGRFVLENSDVITDSCNKQKNNLTGVEFQMLMDLLNTFPKEAKADALRRLAAGGRMFR
jgi:5-methylcytosine-specific restriction endonuclease McrA